MRTSAGTKQTTIVEMIIKGNPQAQFLNGFDEAIVGFGGGFVPPVRIKTHFIEGVRYHSGRPFYFQRRQHMKEHSDVPQDPYADGITNPIRETPIDIDIAPPFPPNQDASTSTIGSADPTAEAGGPIGDVHTTHDNLSDC